MDTPKTPGSLLRDLIAAELAGESPEQVALLEQQFGEATMKALDGPDVQVTLQIGNRRYSNTK